mmetsp:Transcript_2896/g.7981  ORF Transcript_2896/g.7981 Transcript_2896/m.7981 type:complete len:260 (-) Transcript_2896:736-1515(-)
MIFGPRLLMNLICSLLLCLLTLAPTIDATPQPLQRVQVTMRGAVLYISDVTTVKELQERIHEETGLTHDEQGTAIYQGTILEQSDCLSDRGITDGAQVNMIPKPMANHFRMLKDMEKGLKKLKMKLAFSTDTHTMQRDQNEIQAMEKLLADLALKVPMLQENLNKFVGLLKHPDGVERAKDPDRIEGLRQVIINNPMLMKYALQTEPCIPGFSMMDTLLDPNAWYQQATRAVDRWSTMSGFDLWESLVGGTLFAAGDGW